MSVAWNHGVVCIRSSRSVSWVSTCRSKWMMPRLPPQVLGHAAHGRVADRVVAAEHDRERARLRRRGATALEIWSKVFSMFAGDREDVAEVGDGDRLAQVDAELEAVRAVERGDLADALRAEPGAGAVGRAAVERRAEHRDVVLAAAADVLDVGRLEEGVDAGEVRQLAAGEGRDAFVDDGVGARQAELQAAGDLLVPLGGRQLGLALDRVAGLGAVVVVQLGVGVAVGVPSADGGGSATELLRRVPGRRAAGPRLSPGLLSRRGTARRDAAACASRTSPPVSASRAAEP